MVLPHVVARGTGARRDRHVDRAVREARGDVVVDDEGTLTSDAPALAGLLGIDVAPGPGASVFDLVVSAERPESVLGPVVMAAARLLTAPETLARIRRCDAENCRWFFVDRSKNRSRRWCDMQVCGNRAKAREYYRQHRRRD